MITIIMHTTLAHPVFGCAGPGDTITVDEKTGRDLIAGRFADLVSEPVRESAALKTPEKAVISKATLKSR